MKCGCHSHNGFQLSPEGLAQRRGYSSETVDMFDDVEYVDKVGSVSGLEQERNIFVFDDGLLDQQYRRFLNGS